MPTSIGYKETNSSEKAKKKEPTIQSSIRIVVAILAPALSAITIKDSRKP